MFEPVCGTLLWPPELTNTVYLHSPISSHFSDISSRVQISHTDSLLWWLWGILFPEPVLFKVSLDRGREGRAMHLRRCFSYASVVPPEETPWLPKVRPERMVTSMHMLVTSTHILASSTSDPSSRSCLVTSLECTECVNTYQNTHQRNSQFSVPVPTLCEMFQHLRFCGELHIAAVIFKFGLCSKLPGWARAPHIPRIALNKLGRGDSCRDDSAGNTPVGPAAAAAKSLQSCPTLCDPTDGSLPVSPIPGILQARTLEWVAISFSNA